MPFSFPLLFEFFFPGLVLFAAVAFLVDLLLPAEVAAIIKTESTGNLVAFIFIVGLISYFIGTTVNAVSNRIIRVRMLDYRSGLVLRKLTGAKAEQRIIWLLRHFLFGTAINQPLADEVIDGWDDSRRRLISAYLPELTSKDPREKLNELFAAARTFCSVHSPQTSKTIDYHWALMRLSRATLLPWATLTLVLFVRAIVHHAHLVHSIAFVVCLVQLLATFTSYCYREKFLVYTVFDTFFESAKSDEGTAPS